MGGSPPVSDSSGGVGRMITRTSGWQYLVGGYSQRDMGASSPLIPMR